MLSRTVSVLEISQRPINNVDNTGPTEEGPREHEMNTNRQSQLSAIFRPILIALKLTGQFFGETALARIGSRRTGYISRSFSTLIVLGQWLLVVLSVISHFHIGYSTKRNTEFFLLLVSTIWHAQCACSTTVCLVVLPLVQNRRQSRFARFISSFVTSAPDLEGLKEKAVKGLTCGCLAVLINIVVVTYLSVCCGGLISTSFPAWYPHTYLAVRVIEMVVGTFDSFAWILPVLIFCITCMLLEKAFESLQDKMSKEFITFTIAHLRREHLKLCEMVELADAAFSPLLFVIVSLDIPLMCINLHQFIKSTSNQGKTIATVSYLYWSLCIATLLGVVFMFGSRVNEKVRTFYIPGPGCSKPRLK